METITIHRSLKRPGLIDRARTYRIVSNADGLYFICLGKATLEVPQRGEIIAEAIAGKIVESIAAKFEKEIRETEARLEKEGVVAMAKTPKSYFIPRSALSLLEAKQLGDGVIRLTAKGNGVNITLDIHPYYKNAVDRMIEVMR
jgi:hypothetical protein